MQMSNATMQRVLEQKTGGKYLNSYCRSRFIVHEMTGRLQTIRDGLEMPKNTRSHVFRWVTALFWSQDFFFFYDASQKLSASGQPVALQLVITAAVVCGTRRTGVSAELNTQFNHISSAYR